MKTHGLSQSSAALGVLCAVGAATMFSTAGVIVRRLDMPAWDVSFWRSALLVAALLPLLVWQRRGALIDARNAGVALVASAVLLAGSFVAFILALGLAPVANVLLMFGATPFITALLARLFLGEPLHVHTIVTMLTALIGLSISVAGSLKAGGLAGMAVAGIVVLCMSGNYVVVRHRRDVGMAPAIWLAGVISALVALPFARPEAITWSQLPWLLALSPGQLAGGLLLYMASLRRIPAGRAALLGLLELVLGPLWVWLFDGEKPDDLTLIGGAIVIGAAAANVWLDSRRATG
ncbi:DMT family transporter [Reyranella sp.]|uniref:DMT family transporter n=1 Tax=Reyranella sp. TaxID=1929291 RepID=UPI003BAA3D94